MEETHITSENREYVLINYTIYSSQKVGLEYKIFLDRSLKRSFKINQIKEELEEEFNKAKEQAVAQGEQLLSKYEKHSGKNQKLRDKLDDFKAKMIIEEKEKSYTNLASTSDSDV